MQISGQTTALVTGANRGLGLALVETLLQRGAGRVYAAARATSTLRTFERYGDRVVPVHLDLTDTDSINTAAAGAPEVNLLINNAAAAAFAPALVADREGLETEFRTNYLGTYDVTTAFAPALARHRGAVVMVLSMLALVNEPSMAGYSASKHALHAMTDSLRAGLGPQGVAVYAAYPAGIDTDMLAGRGGAKSSPEVVAGGIVDGIQTGQPVIFPDSNARRMAAQLGMTDPLRPPPPNDS